MKNSSYYSGFEADEFPESRSATFYAQNKQVAIADRLLHFPRAEVVEVEVLERPRGKKPGKYHVVVSEDLD